MYCPLLEIESFGGMSPEQREQVIRFYLEALTYANMLYLRGHPETPSVYEAGLRYVQKNRPFGLDLWQDVPATLRKGGGDCKDFACWRMAERRLAGEKGLEFAIETGFDANLGEEVTHCAIFDGESFEDPTHVLAPSLP